MHGLRIAGEAPLREHRTTDTNHAYPRFADLVEDLKVGRPDQAWVADITHVRLKQDFIYLAVIINVFTRKVQGRHLGRSLEQGLTLTAPSRALEQGRPEVQHPDQGVQYAA